MTGAPLRDRVLSPAATEPVPVSAHSGDARSRKWAWYNEIDPFAAAWLRELIKQNLIAPGEVDERDIRDVKPDDLRSFRQCHFFAGIGVWSYSMRRAGWPDDRAVWTGSCPCQPFSSAGRGGGFDDERHLWPAWQWLIEQRRPSIVFGEQVASKDGYAWLDLVQADMEALGDAFGAVVLPAAGFGAPHGRHRTFFVSMADTGCERGAGRRELRDMGGAAAQDEGARGQRERFRDAANDSGATFKLADAYDSRLEGRGGMPERPSQCAPRPHGMARRLADADMSGEHERAPSGEQSLRDLHRHGAVRGFWANADWIPCRGGKWRPIEPGTFPLAHGAPARMGRLRGYGNAINAEVATGFIEAVIDHLSDRDASYARDRADGLGPEVVAARAEGIAQPLSPLSPLSHDPMKGLRR